MNNGKWTEAEISFVTENVGKMAIEEMAKHLKKSALAVKLFLHRRKINIGQTVKRNILQEMLKSKFRHPENFMPNRKFYNEVGINQMRWWDLYHGRKPLTQEEYISLAEYFGITMQEAFDARQLNLFNTEDDER